MSMINISVIMPLYNAEKYLGEAIQSILQQTYKDFELICINDASTDRTMEIVREFQIMDSRIKVFENQERAGAAVSRNRGICEAKGKYITFLDGDDIFDEEMLELAYKKAEKHDVDVVMYEYMHAPSNYIYEKKYKARSSEFMERYCSAPFSILEDAPLESLGWSTSPCNKLYKRSFILTNHLEFQTLPSANDVYFVEMVLLLAGKIIVLSDRRVMVYARDHETLTRISHDRNPMCAYWALEKVGEELVKRNVSSAVMQHYYYRTVHCFMKRVLREKNRERAEDFYSFLQNEGVDKLLRLSADCGQKPDEYINMLLGNFKEKDFHTEWYKETSTFKFRLLKNFERVLSLFRAYADESTHVCIWGMGKNGRILLDFLQQHDIKVADVVDSDESKQGECIYDYIIKSPKEVLKDMQTVIACSNGIYWDIAPMLEEKNIEVINIGQMVRKE